MKQKNQKNDLRDLIINNPRAKSRIAIKEIEKQVKRINKNFMNKNKSVQNLNVI